MKYREHKPLTRIVRGSVKHGPDYLEGWWISSDSYQEFNDGGMFFSSPQGPYVSREAAWRAHVLMLAKHRIGESQNYEQFWLKNNIKYQSKRILRPVERNIRRRKQVEHLAVLPIT